MARLVDHAAVPTSQMLITNAVAKAKQCRYKLREKAVAGIFNQGAKTSLRDVSSFSKSLFDSDAITKAEECLKGALVIVFSSDRCSITYPWLVLVLVVVLGVLVLLFFLCRFNFSQEQLGIIHCNFADMFSILLLNDFQSLNTFEILVWDIFAFFAPNLWT